MRKCCPFCGGFSLNVVLFLDENLLRVKCRECGSFGPVKSEFKESASAWEERNYVSNKAPEGGDRCPK